jgi:adenylosuccinate synthase
MEANIVIGLGFGDEGKGLTTDSIASKKDPATTIVVRFSGGQQAGHTVVIDKLKHTYSSFGSGTGRGIPTYLSEYCTFYPPYALNEYNSLVDKGLTPSLYIHPLAKLTTYWDVAWGRLRERIYAHGSCGMGVGATMARSEQTPHKLFIVDLKHTRIMYEKLDEIGRYYEAKLKELGLETEMKTWFYLQADSLKLDFRDSLMSEFMRNVVSYGIVSYDKLTPYKSFIFEGSQGILLDDEHGIFPNVTYSHTTSRNAIELCNKMGISQLGNIDLHYVTRSYLTRHGKGWLPSEEDMDFWKSINNIGEANKSNEWQGHFQVRELDYNLLNYALDVDDAYSWGYRKHLIVTCLDQRKNFTFDYTRLSRKFASIHESWSPDSKDFKRI